MASLASRHRQVCRLLRRAEGLRPNSEGYARLKIAGETRFVHRLVMETLLGRTLRRDEHVHHLDGNKANNRPANLQLLAASEHNSRTNRRHPLLSFCKWCHEACLTRCSSHGLTQYCSRRCANLSRWARHRRAKVRPRGCGVRGPHRRLH